MANHLTPEKLSKEMGLDRQEVIRVCVEEGVPIYQGKIDKTLFQAQLQAIGGPTPSRAPYPTDFVTSSRRRGSAPPASWARPSASACRRRRVPARRCGG